MRMIAFNQVPARLPRTGAASVLTLAAVGGSVMVPGAAGQARAASVPLKALRVAAAQQGSPYRYGASGPGSFDCSGLTGYAYRHAGKPLPRTAAQQYASTRHIAASDRAVGDLVFFHSGGSGRSVYHVGLYAGQGRIWHAPRTGEVVKREKIWTSGVWYGRVR